MVFWGMLFWRNFVATYSVFSISILYFLVVFWGMLFWRNFVATYWVFSPAVVIWWDRPAEFWSSPSVDKNKGGNPVVGKKYFKAFWKKCFLCATSTAHRLKCKHRLNAERWRVKIENKGASNIKSLASWKACCKFLLVLRVWHRPITPNNRSLGIEAREL